MSPHELAAAIVTQGNREVIHVEQYLRECRHRGIVMTVARAYDDIRNARRALAVRS